LVPGCSQEHRYADRYAGTPAALKDVGCLCGTSQLKCRSQDAPLQLTTKKVGDFIQAAAPPAPLTLTAQRAGNRTKVPGRRAAPTERAVLHWGSADAGVVGSLTERAAAPHWWGDDYEAYERWHDATLSMKGIHTGSADFPSGPTEAQDFPAALR